MNNKMKTTKRKNDFFLLEENEEQEDHKDHED